jgi:hypothetical protein
MTTFKLKNVSIFSVSRKLLKRVHAFKSMPMNNVRHVHELDLNAYSHLFYRS